MKNANVLSFQEISDTLTQLTTLQILTELQNCANLVQVLLLLSL